MPGPPAAVAAVRVAVRRDLADDLAAGDLVLVACSGGADSLALLAATAFEGPRAGLRVGVLTVDHGWTADSHQRAEAVVAVAKRLGADPALVLTVSSPRTEDAARRARYAAFDAAAARLDAAAVLLAHSLDDQAETVLLGLARGSGARSLAGMAARRCRYRRPLLGLRRETLRAAALAEGLEPWDDPANTDRGFARARVRHDVLPLLEEQLGPGVIDALGRTAGLLAADADALDDWAAAAGPGWRRPGRRRLARPSDRGAQPAHPQAGHPRRRERRCAQCRARRVDGGAAVRLARSRCGCATRRSGRRTNVWQAGSSPRRATVLTDEESWCATPTTRGRADLTGDIDSVLISAEEIQAKIAQLAKEIDADYAGRELLLVGVLKGACMVMADLARALTSPIVTMDFMAVSSYGSATSSSGVVRILKDLDRDIAGRHVLLVEDIIDSGLTLSWLLRNLRSRGPASVEVCALLRKPDAAQVDVPVRYMGFDIPNEFVVGYGLDYAERYRNLPFVGTLRAGLGG